MYHAPVRQMNGTHRAARWTYLGEDESAYYYMDGFFDDVGNMFKRMVKFTPKSFTPSNLYKGFVNTTLTTATGGIYLALPKSIKKPMYEIGKVAIPVVAGGALLSAANPALMSTLMSKFGAVAAKLGKNPKVIGGAVTTLLNQLPQAQQTQVAEQLTVDQLAQIEQGQVSPDVQALINRAIQQAYYPPSPPMSLEQAYGSTSSPQAEPVQAGMFEGGGGMMLFVGLSAVGLVLFGMPRKR